MIYRIFDIILLIALVPIFFPIFIIIYVFLYFKIGKPVLFIQKRSGLNGKEFKLYKFRTMANINSDAKKEKNIKSYIDMQKRRVLNSTKFLRRTRLDEIPQLLNILLNDLSFVGPRPLLIEYNSLYDFRQRTRLNVQPGITGWSQIKSESTNSWKEKFELDIWYVENKSIYLNLKIILLTIKFFLQKILIDKEKEIILNDKFNGKN